MLQYVACCAQVSQPQQHNMLLKYILVITVDIAQPNVGPADGS